MADIFAEFKTAQAHITGWNLLDLDTSRSIHVAVMSEPFLTYVFEGKKTVESRFSLHKIAPYNRVKSGDLVFMKAGPIVGCFTVVWVKEFNLAEYPIEAIKKEYGERICADDNFWQQKASKQYATLIGIGDVRRLAPLAISKRDRRGWITL